MANPDKYGPDKYGPDKHGSDKYGELTRRNLLMLAGGTALAAACGVTSNAFAAFDTRQFIDLSARLLEINAGSLDPDVAEKFLSNLTATGKESALNALATGTADPALEQQIITSWYSGLQQTQSGEELVAYSDALLWDALDYTKPQGFCGGETGYWALPPDEG